MKTNKQLLLGAAAAALLALNPAFAGGGKSAGVNAETDAKAGVNADSQTLGKQQSGASADIGASARSDSGKLPEGNASAGGSADVEKDKSGQSKQQNRDSKEKQGTNRY
jgi:hypothetical protein